MQFAVVTTLVCFILGLLGVPLVAQSKGVEKVWRLAVLSRSPRPEIPKHLLLLADRVIE